MMLLTALLTAFIADADLPVGFQKAAWGMTVEELQRVAPAERILPGEGFNYAEHLEEDPEVYVTLGEAHERIEYYFFEERLYKIFIIYDRMLYHTKFYQELVEEITAQFGPPDKDYDESFYDLVIHHTLWEDSVSDLDLRKGAGFVYQVRIDKAAAEKKAGRQKKKQGI